MNFLQLNFTHAVTLQLAVVSVSSLWLMTPFPKAPVMESVKILKNSKQHKLQAAQEQVCPSDDLIPKRTFHTAKDYIYICRGERLNSLGYYIRISKNGSNKITVPISSKNGETYTAIQGEITYMVTPYELIITKLSKGGSVNFREKVNSAIAADGKPLARGCPDGNNTFVEAKTKNFIVYICGKELPSSYVAVARQGNDKITIPLQSYKFRVGIEDSQFVAVNGDIRYLLTRSTLKVSRDSKTIIKEKVLYWN
ncbi:hypothetical protein QUB80_07155 [Chlorogloeopsis sp. ULAP01]|uniref:hypothetical protein n=1 Tax=Chlorogloeopsis sp. ULAP01 TaxID=3056483 RepID=UPI0025AA628F|nr:hypothetical protein [Chlorogloeopsis sp. ULAP01]MDM9380480.1 hypothetical protein [Chlorogloeopsis sp. ULAP01]